MSSSSSSSTASLDAWYDEVTDLLCRMYFSDERDLKKTVRNPFNLRRLRWPQRAGLLETICWERTDDYARTVERLLNRIQFEIEEHNQCVLASDLRLDFGEYCQSTDEEFLASSLAEVLAFRKETLEAAAYY